MPAPTQPPDFFALYIIFISTFPIRAMLPIHCYKTLPARDVLMPNILTSDAPLLILAPTLPTTANILVAVAVVVAALIYHTSPQRLTHILVTAIIAAEKTYLDALETGCLSPSDVEIAAEMLAMLQLEVSKIREVGLRNSRSHWKTFCGFFQGHTLIVQRCIWEIQDLSTHIEILKEEHLRERNLIPLAAVHLRRRRECNGII
ncbi:hypothetical protein MVEN_00966000 [Mycena venus]|uniref:Uncharacterized protein n=1 Tax=Mycena venus TaxID=2733690 RepID=A0A8H7D1U5_9AGAR|nr:hypothetical protein MVEN_00966000 [Mycena venus]